MNLHKPIATKAGTYSLFFCNKDFNYFSASSKLFESFVAINAEHSSIVVSTPLPASSSMSSRATTILDAVVNEVVVEPSPY
jgi:hypothetical protein